MMNSAFCEKHGPYDSRYSRCPYCDKEQKWQSGRDMPLDSDPPDFALPPDDDDEVEPNHLEFLDDWSPDPPLQDDDATILDIPAVDTPLGFLIVKAPVEQRGTVYVVKPDDVIGRKEADVAIAFDKKISRRHARMTFEPTSPLGSVIAGSFVLTDLDTLNGTYVNHTRINSATRLMENDEIGLGDMTFVFKVLL